MSKYKQKVQQQWCVAKYSDLTPVILEVGQIWESPSKGSLRIISIEEEIVAYQLTGSKPETKIIEGDNSFMNVLETHNFSLTETI